MKLDELFKFYMGFPSFINTKLFDVNQKGDFGETPIEIAASRGSLSELELLINNHADINIHGEHGYTALHSAIEQGHKYIVAYLIKNGANISLTNDDGLTALDLAKVSLEIEESSERKEILKMLEQHLKDNK